MDSDSWIRLSSASSRRFHSRSDVYNVGGEEYCEGGEEESRPEYLCPFCDENFDMVGLCCHIDEEHAIEAKNGRKRRFRRGGSNSTFSILRKELRGGNFQSLLGGSSGFVSSSTSQADPLLSSFIVNPPAADEMLIVQSLSSTEKSRPENSSAGDLACRKVEPPLLSEKDQEEEARKCEFVQGLLLSTFLDDDL